MKFQRGPFNYFISNLWTKLFSILNIKSNHAYIYGCCLLLEIRVLLYFITGNSLTNKFKYKMETHFDQSRRKTIKIFLPAIKIIKTGVYMPAIFFTLPAWGKVTHVLSSQI